MNANSKKPPAAPPVYRPQPVPKVLQRKVSGHGPHIGQPLRTSFVRGNIVANTIQRAEQQPVSESQRLKALHQARRQARAFPSHIGNKEVDDEQDRLANERVDVTQQSVRILEQLKKEDWATKKMGRTGAEVNFDIRSGLGETNRTEGPLRKPIISLGNEALTSAKMGRITLRHELDHAKLQVDGKKLKLGGFVASYQGRGPDERAKKDTFEHRLEELIVRLRDLQRLTQNKTEKAPEYDAERAKARIKEEYKLMLAAKDIDEYDTANVKDIIGKLHAIARELEADLD